MEEISPSPSGRRASPIVFRVLKTTPVGLSVDDSIRLDLSQDVSQSELDPGRLPSLPAGYAAPSTPFQARIQQSDASCAVDGGLLLPRSFANLHLGEKFSAYVTATNVSDGPVTALVLKATMQTASTTHSVYDGRTPIAALAPGSRHDFMITCDIKELGTHTLSCHGSHTQADHDRRIPPQQFKFLSVNPLSVKTKTRHTGGATFLEVWLENPTGGTHTMESVRFMPLPHLEVTQLRVPPPPPPDAGPLHDYMARQEVLQAGDTRSYLFRLPRKAGVAQEASKAAGLGLGKLEMRWRNSFGDAGKLQTQQINAASLPALRFRPVALAVAHSPAEVMARRAFRLTLRLSNAGEGPMPPALIRLQEPAAGGGGGGMADVLMDGPQEHRVGPLPPGASAELDVDLLSLRSGLQAVALGAFSASDNTVLDLMEPFDVYVLAS